MHVELPMPLDGLVEPAHLHKDPACCQYLAQYPPRLPDASLNACLVKGILQASKMSAEHLSDGGQNCLNMLDASHNVGGCG